MRVRDLTGRSVVVWGYGMEGRASVRLLLRHARPAKLTVVVDGDEVPVMDSEFDDVAVVRSSNNVVVRGVEVIVKSPGVSPYHGPFADAVAGRDVLVTGGTALWFAETNGDRTVAVTGSKGKSTTSTLVAHLFAAVGRPATLAGNVGRALLDVLDEELSGGLAASDDAWYAVETSSFQAAEVRNSPEVGVLTALFPEHLDWHGSVERYYTDKCNLFAHRGDIGVAANADNAEVARRIDALPGVRTYGSSVGLHARSTAVCRPDGTVVVDTAGSALRGRHNVLNLCGALTALELAGVDLAAHSDALSSAIASFRLLAHRLEVVGEVGGRLVVDDSLSTAPEAAVAALAAFDDRPVGIIVGGHDRGLDYSTLASALALRTTPTWVCGVPNSGERIVPLIEKALERAGTDRSIVRVEAFSDFDDAVHRAAAVVPPGGVILLSPAAPSFGRFANYAERGLHFRSLLGLSE